MSSWGIKRRVRVWGIVPIMLFSALFGLLHAVHRAQSLREEFTRDGNTLVRQFATTSTYALMTKNGHILQHHINIAANEPNIIAAAVYDNKGKLLAYNGPNNLYASKLAKEQQTDALSHLKNLNNTVTFLNPVYLPKIDLDDYLTGVMDNQKLKPTNSELLGWIAISLDYTSVYLGEYQGILVGTFIFVLGIAIAFLLSRHFLRFITRPIIDIAESLKKIKSGHYDIHVNYNEEDELGEITQAVNTLATQLKNVEEETDAYVSNITKELEQTLENMEMKNVELELSSKSQQRQLKEAHHFLNHLSEELRIPVNTMLTYTQLLLQSDTLTTKQQPYFQQVYDATVSVLSVITDVIHFANNKSSRYQVKNIPMELKSRLSLIFQKNHYSSIKHDIEYVPIVYTDLPTKILTDPFRLTQAITTFLEILNFMLKSTVVPIRIFINDTHETIKLSFRFHIKKNALPKEQADTLHQAIYSTNPIEKMPNDIEFNQLLIKQLNGRVEFEASSADMYCLTFEMSCEMLPSENNESKQTSNLPPIKTILVDLYDGDPTSIAHIVTHLGLTVLDKAQSIENIDTNDIDILIVNAHFFPSEKEKMKAFIHKLKRKVTVNTILLVNYIDNDILHEVKTSSIALLEKPVTQQNLYALIAKLSLAAKETPMIEKKMLAPDHPALDWAECLSLCNNDETFAHDILNEFMMHLEKDIDLIDQHYSVKDYAELTSVIHRLHGAACYCGVPRLRALLKTLNTALSNEDYATFEKHYPTLVIEVRALTDAVKAHG